MPQTVAFDTLFSTILQERNLGKAIAQFKAMVKELNVYSLDARLEVLEGNYERMKSAFLQGLQDVGRTEFHTSLLQTLYGMVADLEMAHKHANDRFFQHACIRMQGWDDDFESIKSNLARFVQDFAILELTDGDDIQSRRKELYLNHQMYINTLFEWIVASWQWTEHQSDEFVQLLTENSISKIDSQTLVSAIGLACVNRFDFQKYMALLRIHKEAGDDSVALRAYTWSVLSLGKESELFMQNNGPVMSDLHTADGLSALLYQMLMSEHTDEITAKVQNEILPQMMQSNRFNMQTMDFEKPLDTDPADIFESEELDRRFDALEKGIEKFMQLQQTGADLHYAGFSRMKNGLFFQSMHATSNWMLPFFEDNPEVFDTENKESILKMLSAMSQQGSFCDSDKYSMALYMKSMNLGNLNPGIMEMVGEAQEATDNISVNVLVERKVDKIFLKDIYRLFRLYPRRANFRNKLDLKHDGRDCFMMICRLLNNPEGAESLLRLAIYMYQHHYSAELDILFAAVDVKDNISLALLKARHLLRMGLHSEAVELLRLIQAPDEQKEKLQSLLAKVYYKMGQYGDAVKIYKELLAQDEQSEKYTFNLSLAQIYAGNISEALHLLYKLTYNYPGKPNYSLALSYALLKSADIAKALEVLQSVDGEEALQGRNKLYEGYVFLFMNLNSEALSCFRQYLDKQGKTPQLLCEDFAQDNELLCQYGIGPVEQNIILESLS